MNLLYSLFLGLLQGLTEFLPVSSSGHLVLMQNLLPGFFQPGVLFDVVLHLGTFLAVLVFFRKKIFRLPPRYYWLLAVASLPAVAVGLLFQSRIESLFSSVKVVGAALLLTGVMNLLTDKISNRQQPLTFRKAWLTGVFQALAIIPGISRSGSTIFASSLQGIDKKQAAEFSFLLSLPAVFGANVLEIYKYGLAFKNNWSLYVIGLASAFLAGLLALKLVFDLIAQRRFKLFAVYCLFLGTFILLIF